MVSRHLDIVCIYRPCPDADDDDDATIEDPDEEPLRLPPLGGAMASKWAMANSSPGCLGVVKANEMVGVEAIDMVKKSVYRALPAVRSFHQQQQT